LDEEDLAAVLLADVVEAYHAGGPSEAMRRPCLKQRAGGNVGKA
ncbi:MAG: hypothetical protein JWO64_2569, partial [Hyphomicrobiales bacterium]|nr:hypothetical protein [Hyphomicrobiales bacterium]